MQIILVTHPGRRPLSVTVRAWQIALGIVVLVGVIASGPIYASFSETARGGLLSRALEIWDGTQSNVLAGKIGELRARLDSMEAALEVNGRAPEGGLQRQSLRLEPRSTPRSDEEPAEELELLSDRANRVQAAIETQLVLRENALRSVLQQALVTPVQGRFSSGFGWRSHPIHGERAFHRGLDFAASAGTPVLAVAGGVVTFIGPAEAYGKLVVITHEGGVVTRYAHLEGIEVTTGMAVPAGTRIGRVGSTGRSTGPHLHFEIELHGRAVNPEPFLRPGMRSPLLHAAAT